QPASDTRVERIQPRQSGPVLGGPHGVAGPLARLGEGRARLLIQSVDDTPLIIEPLLELASVAEMEPVEEAAAIGVHDTPVIAGAGRAQEIADVARDDRRIQSDIGAADEELLGEALSNGEGELLERTPSLFLSAVRPEEQEKA